MTLPVSRTKTALTLLAASTLLGGGAARAATWSPTATQALSVATLSHAVDLGAMPAGQTMTVRLGLNMQYRNVLLGMVKAQTNPSSPLYGWFLTPAQFASMFGASNSQVSSVVAYLKGAGFTNVTVEPNNLMVSADGTAAMAEAAFNTKLEMVSVNGTTGFINTAVASVPASLGGVVGAVLGLNSIGRMHPFLALPTLPLPQYGVSYTPKQFQQLYSVAPVKAACCTAIAIMAEGNLTGVVSDLRIAEKAFGLPQVPVTIRQVGLASPDTSGADEWDLDSQSSSGIATQLRRLYLYATTSLSDSDLALEFSKWASDDVARAASASLGECEVFPYVDGSMLVDDETFLEAASQGQSFFASSGDTGSFCPVTPTNGVPAGLPFVSYPASSPYVIGVGGTTLLANADGNYNTEITWYAGGGGVSQFEGSPFWQQAAVSTLKTANLRGVPDIAMDADPETGALIYVNGVPEGIGGTSLSSPLALGAWALTINTDWKLGFAGPALYSLYDGTGLTGAYPKGGYHDILVGTNGLYTAGPGYDLTTGLGTLIVNQLVAGLK